MSTVLTETSNFPIHTDAPIHDGKVRSVYWLSPETSAALAETRGYEVPEGESLGIMIISDRLSAFECIWTAEGDLRGVPMKGAALNAIALYWFEQFEKAGIASHHIVEAPHPLLWVIRKARPLRFEGIVRQYITGSLWRSYERGNRTICGLSLPDGLSKNQRLDSLLFTPTTKGTLTGLEGIPEEEDTQVSQEQILKYADEFNLADDNDLQRVYEMLKQSVALMEDKLESIGQIFVDTKFEFGYIRQMDGTDTLAMMDEVGTPDSSRFWDAEAFAEGTVREVTKEQFRGFLLNNLDKEVLTRSERWDERQQLAKDYRVPMDAWMDVSRIYTTMAEQITGKPLPTMEAPREELLSLLGEMGILR